MMRRIPLSLKSTSLALLLGACATVTAYGPASDWRGDLRPPTSTGFIGGEARLQPSGTDSTQVSVLMTGADTTQSYPWRLHHNLCNTKTGRDIVNQTFTPIKVASGTGNNPTSGSASAVVPIKMPVKGLFSVEVLAPGSNIMDDKATVLACADLMPKP